MTYYIFRADPDISPPPSDDPTLSVPLAADDRAIVTVGVKMFSSSDVSIINRSAQTRRIGRRSNGRFGDVSRYEPSHGKTINVAWDGVELEDAIFENLDQHTQDAIAGLVFSRHLIVSTDPKVTAGTAGWLTPAAIRSL